MAAIGVSSTTAARSPYPIGPYFPSSFLLCRSRFSAISSSSPARSSWASFNTLHKVQNCVFFRSPLANGSVRYTSCFLPLSPSDTNISTAHRGRIACKSAYQGYKLQVNADMGQSVGRMIPRRGSPSVSEDKTSHHNQKVSDHLSWRGEAERLRKSREQNCGVNAQASFGRSSTEMANEEFNRSMTQRMPSNLNGFRMPVSNLDLHPALDSMRLSGDMRSTPELSMAADGYYGTVTITHEDVEDCGFTDGSSYIQSGDIKEVIPKPPNAQSPSSARKFNGQQSMHSQTTKVEIVRKSQKGISSLPPKERINGSKMMNMKSSETVVGPRKDVSIAEDLDPQDRLRKIYGEVLIVDNISMAKNIVSQLTNEYRHMIHACDTEVANIDVKQETPVDHGEVICFSIYSGPEADFGGGKSCIWVDVLDGGGKDMLLEFAKFFEDPNIKKVWHNYSFDCHVIRNYGIEVSGFHADTMHMARLWNSSRRLEGGYSLEALTGDREVMSGANLGSEKDLFGKVSMKTIFGKKKLKKDGSEGKIVIIAPVEELQREERDLWICYSALDAISTLKLYDSLRIKLLNLSWRFNDKPLSGKSMFDFYKEYWRDFGEILVKMETEGMLVDRAYLAEIEKQAKAEQIIAANRFRNWASKYCDDAKYMNVGSDTQLRQLLFGGILNRKDSSEALPESKTLKIPNVEGFIQEGKKAASKFRNITLNSIPVKLETEMYTATGWPSVSGAALKTLAGTVSADYDIIDDSCELGLEEIDDDDSVVQVAEAAKKPESTIEEDMSAYGTAYTAFLPDKESGKEACHAIAALCEMCSIDSLISNFILPLQGSNISGKDERIHCSLNINTETGRLSARRPNLQNQPALEKDRYKIRQAFIAAPGKSLIVADYGQLELRVLAHLANCKSMLEAFKAGGDFHSRTALNMYQHIQDAVENGEVILEWHPQPGQEKPPVPLLKDAFGSERRKAKMLNFSIAYGKTPIGLARDWKVSVEEAKETVNLWYKERQEVLVWQQSRKQEAHRDKRVHTLLGRARTFPSLARASYSHRNHIERAAINAPVQGSAADIAMCAMLEICKNQLLKELGWKLLLQVHDEVILEGPTESAEVAKAIVVDCMAKPFNGTNFLKVELAVDAKCAGSWYAAK